jgi:hypothetical protein
LKWGNVKAVISPKELDCEVLLHFFSRGGRQGSNNSDCLLVSPAGNRSAPCGARAQKQTDMANQRPLEQARAKIWNIAGRNLHPALKAVFSSAF